VRRDARQGPKQRSVEAPDDIFGGAVRQTNESVVIVDNGGQGPAPSAQRRTGIGAEKARAGTALAEQVIAPGAPKGG